MKNIFLKVLALTILIFVIGLYGGVLLDNYRLSAVSDSVTEIDNLWNDARLLQSYIERYSQNSTDYCSLLLSENLVAGDKIYKEGLMVEDYEKANRFTPSLVLEKERYALLDLQFWQNTVDLKKACNANYSTVIYFYSQYNKTVVQGFEDNVLLDLKQKCGPQIIYITFPADMNITTLDTIKKIYNITSLPAVMINESVVLYSPITMQDMDKYVKC